MACTCTINFLLPAKDHVAKTWSMAIMVIMMTNVDDKTLVRIMVNLFELISLHAECERRWKMEVDTSGGRSSYILKTA